MDKKKTIVVIAAVAVLAVAGICGGIFLAARNKNHTPVDSPFIQEDSEVDISVFQSAINKSLETNSSQTDVPLFISSLNNACSCKVISVSPTESGDKYTAVVKLTYANIADELKKHLDSLGTSELDVEKLNNDISEMVNHSDTADAEFEIDFISNQDSYTPIFTEEMIDKMYGGIYSAYYEKVDELSNGLKGSE